jgi:predicted RNA-binding protein YlxR (DUF448 family)
MCIACRETADKKSLVRIVNSDGGIIIDETGKHPGRGAYLHPSISCWELGLKKSLESALKAKLSDHDRNNLIQFKLNLEETPPNHSNLENVS